MSSTNRGGAKRSPTDNYPTPSWCVDRILEALELPFGRWLEPAAGAGRLVAAVDRRRGGLKWTAVEKDRRHLPRLRRATDGKILVGDFLDAQTLPFGRRTRPFQVAITNPPFRQALPFVRKCLAVARWVIVLQRLNFLGSVERAAFFHGEMPDVFVLPDRPIFRGGHSDSTEYAWFVWGPRRGRRRGSIRVLRTTPPGDRGMRSQAAQR